MLDRRKFLLGGLALGTSPFIVSAASKDDDYSVLLQSKIDTAAREVRQSSNPKWPHTSGYVEIPSGVFKMRTPVRLRSGVSVFSNSQASTILLSDMPNGEPLFYSDPNDELYATGLSGFHAIDIKGQTSDFLRIHNANRNCIFNNMFIENFSCGIWSRDCFTTVFRDIGIYRCQNGIHGQNLTNGRIHSVKVENCFGTGLRLEPSKNNTTTGTLVDGFVAQGNGQYGVLLDSLDQIEFRSLFLEGNNRPAMRRPTDQAEYSQICVTGENRNAPNLRNGSIAFNSTFITRGHSDIRDTIAVDLNFGTSIQFRSGYLRNFKSAFSTAFKVSKDVKSAHIEDLTLEGFRADQVAKSTGNLTRERINLLSAN